MEMKRDCEVHAASKEPIPCESTFGDDTEAEDIPVMIITDDMKDWLSSAKLWSADTHCDTHFDNRQIINLVSDDEEEVDNVSNHQFDSFQCCQNSNGGTFHLNLNQKRSDPSIRGGISSSGPMVQFEPMSIDPREKRVRNIHGPSSFTIGQEPPMKKQRVWSADLQRKFLHAMQILDGPLATPKNVLDYMQVDDLTEDEIRTIMLKHRLAFRFGRRGVSPLSPPSPSEDALRRFRQEVFKLSENLIQSGPQQMPLRIGESSNGQVAATTNKNLIQSGPQQMPLYIGESSNGQVAAAAAANNTHDLPMAMSKARGRLLLPPSQNTSSGFTVDVLRRQGFTQSGSQQMPPRTGGSSNRRMATAANKANRGRKSVKKPYNKN